MFGAYFGTLAAVLFVYMCLWFCVSILQKRNDVADVAWGLGFVLLAWASFFLSGRSIDTASFRAIGVCALVTVWGVRLAHYIHARHVGRAEDARYAAWRTTWRYFYTRSFFQIYVLQGALLLLVAFPILFINASDGVPLSMFDVLGFTVWAFGFYFEVVGDRQLKAFLADPANKGKLCTTGLWQYTRHPNYFGEVCLWWGVWLFALASSFPITVFGATVPSALCALLGPLTITFLILKVSGIPMLEKSMQKHPDFAAYARRTNMFIPWVPKAE
jgi:steroid 5-alpha reductase family enzyme